MIPRKDDSQTWREYYQEENRYKKLCEERYPEECILPWETWGWMYHECVAEEEDDEGDEEEDDGEYDEEDEDDEEEEDDDEEGDDDDDEEEDDNEHE